ncbi:TetR family transcriptional regulator [Mycobacteroides abscessus subsp. abscessus]|nr:TetR family transcriptional regulator [Mycobacteroides abscessus subsp. abscessus]
MRLTHSLILAPSPRRELASREDAQQYARRYILPIAQALVPAASPAVR